MAPCSSRCDILEADGDAESTAGTVAARPASTAGADAAAPDMPSTLKMARRNIRSRAYHHRYQECKKDGHTEEYCKEQARLAGQVAVAQAVGAAATE